MRWLGKDLIPLEVLVPEFQDHGLWLPLHKVLFEDGFVLQRVPSAVLVALAHQEQHQVIVSEVAQD